MAYWKSYTVIKQGNSVIVGLYDDETTEKERHLDREKLRNIENVKSWKPKQWF